MSARSWLVWGALLAACAPEADDSDAPADDAPPCGDGACADDEDTMTCPYDCGFPYLVIVDQNGAGEGEAPGVDLDAVSLVRGASTSWAVAVAGASIGGPDNAWTDSAEALGPTDSECQTQNFVSLGGQGSWIALSFGEGVGVRAGDRVTVYEISADMCGNDARNDRWEALVATTPDPSTGTYLVTGSGLGEFDVPAF